MDRRSKVNLTIICLIIFCAISFFPVVFIFEGLMRYFGEDINMITLVWIAILIYAAIIISIIILFRYLIKRSGAQDVDKIEVKEGIERKTIIIIIVIAVIIVVFLIYFFAPRFW